MRCNFSARCNDAHTPTRSQELDCRSACWSSTVVAVGFLFKRRKRARSWDLGAGDAEGSLRKAVSNQNPCQSPVPICLSPRGLLAPSHGSSRDPSAQSAQVRAALPPPRALSVPKSHPLASPPSPSPPGPRAPGLLWSLRFAAPGSPAWASHASWKAYPSCMLEGAQLWLLSQSHGQSAMLDA